jgi:hypothetical protein
VSSEAVAEADAELEAVCGVARARRVAEEDADGRVADADYCVAGVEANPQFLRRKDLQGDCHRSSTRISKTFGQSLPVTNSLRPVAS